MSGLDLVAIRAMANRALESGDEMHPSQVIALCDEIARLGPAAKLMAHARAFITAQHIRCAETICQSDRVIESAYEFIEGCCDIVGYLQEDES